MMKSWEWEDLMELRKQSVAFVVDWFVAHGEELEDIEWDSCGSPVADLLADEKKQQSCALFIGGYWADGVPTVEFEDGKVSRWYRGIYWD